MHLDTDRICPCVLRASVFDGYLYPISPRPYRPRRVYDYEMEYYTDSRGGIVIDGEYTPFSPGEVNLRKPGQVVAGVPPYRCYLVCFDLTGDPRRTGPYVFGCEEEARPCYENPILDALPGKIVCPPGSGMEQLFARVCQPGEAQDPMSRLIQKTALTEILCRLYQIAGEGRSHISPGIHRAARRISRHFAEPLCVEQLIAESGFSRATFHRRFLAETGRTPLEMITELRMARAREMLLLTDAPVADIADICGYPDNSYFARIFKKRYGLSPMDFRLARNDQR